MNHASVCKRLATCFSNLTTKCDFTLWAYSECHPPKGVDFRTLRRTWNTEGLEFNTDHTSLTIQGVEPLLHDEFLRLNRLEWLAWAAGTLLRPNAERPERDWFIHVFRESSQLIVRSDNQGKLERVAARSAEVAAELATNCRSLEQLFVPPPDGAWQVPFETLRDEFRSHASGDFEFRLDLHGYTTQRICRSTQEVGRIQIQSLKFGPAVNVRACGAYSCIIDSKYSERFLDLCGQAGRYLPWFLKPPMSLFPSGSWHMPYPRNVDNLLDWFVFLWASSPTAFLSGIEPGDDDSRRAVWHGGNPFLASTLAIDLFLRAFNDKTVPLFALRLAKISPWLQSKDRHVVEEAITVAFQVPDRNSGERGTPMSTKPPRVKRPKISLQDAEIIVQNWLMKNAAQYPDGVTRDAIAKATRVSGGNVSKTKAWMVYQAQLKANSKPKVRSVPLTNEMLAVIPDVKNVSNELEETIREQEEDMANEDRRHKRRHGPS